MPVTGASAGVPGGTANSHWGETSPGLPDFGIPKPMNVRELSTSGPAASTADTSTGSEPRTPKDALLEDTVVADAGPTDACGVGVAVGSGVGIAVSIACVVEDSHPTSSSAIRIRART